MTAPSAAATTSPRLEFGPAPPVRQLPPLAFWLFKRGMKLKEAAVPFRCSPEYVRLICLPFDDPGRRVPTADVIAAIHAYTQGEIGPSDHYPPHLNDSPPPAQVEAA